MQKPYILCDTSLWRITSTNPCLIDRLKLVKSREQSDSRFVPFITNSVFHNHVI